MAKLKTAAPAYTLPRLVHVDYVIHAAAKEEPTAFDPPHGHSGRNGALLILVEDDAQIHAAVKRLANVQKDETVQFSLRQLSDNVHTVVGGYSKQSTGADPVAAPAKKKSKKK